jgi:dTDP-4-dehydrorhamnose 3,5-epimerase
MLIKSTKFHRLFIIEKRPFADKRGFLFRDFCNKELKIIKFCIKQVNISFNKKKYTLRGFHYQQKPFEENKIISCVAGEILNVCIDLRKKSKTYLKIFKKKLSDKDCQSLHVPAGFANAYLTLKPNTKILYYMSNYYNPKLARGIRFDDPFFKISWPTKPEVISKKDLNYNNYKKIKII